MGVMSNDVEEALIGRLLVDPSVIPTLSGKLSADDFTEKHYGRAWAAMERLSAANRPIDLVTLRSEGVSLDDPTRHLTSLHTAPVDEYVAIIRREAFKGTVLGELAQLTNRVRSHDDPADIVNDVQKAVSGILADTGDAGELVALSSVVDEEARSGLSYGIPALDALAQGAGPGDTIVVAARPNIGKTLFAQNVAESWAFESPTPVMFVSLEMPARKLVSRALKHHDRSDLVNYHMFIYDEPRATTALVRAQAARLRLKYGGLRGIVIDYIQLLKDPGDPENIRVARISGECKAVAREFECPMMMLSQLSRNSEYRKDTRPRLSDLRDSGAIEQDADLVIGLWRPDKQSQEMEAIGLKNRDGVAGWTAYLDLDLEAQSVRGGE
jgi:replicative DNA helicase